MSEIDPSQRIVITGSGGVAPVSWDEIKANKSGITDISQTVAASLEGFNQLDVKVAAGANEDIEQDPLVREHRKAVKWMHRSATLSWLAMNRAAAGARLNMEDVDPYRVGFYVGSAFSGTDHLREINMDRIYPFDAFHTLIARVAFAGAMEEGYKGRGQQIGAECASAAASIDSGARDLLPQFFRGELLPAKSDIVVVGGADAAISPSNIMAFSGSLPGAVDKRDDPSIMSTPFDKNAQGLVMGEAGWMLVMETWENAQKRGLTEEDVIAELAGFDAYTDAESRTLAGHEGGVRAMTGALKMAKAEAGEKIYVNAHATSTPEGDPREALIIKDAFGRLGIDLADVYVSSTKGATGHTMGASGALEAHYSTSAVREDVVPGNLKFEEPSEAVEGLNIPTLALEQTVDLAISNSLGFGGGVVALAFRKFKP